MNESMDRVLADWLREGPESGPREGLERALAATRRVGQKPGWTFPERWLPMQLTMARTPSLRPILAIVMVALLTLALVAAALYIGSQRRPLPAPFGPARNGAVVYDKAGDLYIANELSGEARPLVTGPETDGWPGFSTASPRVWSAADRPVPHPSPKRPPTATPPNSRPWQPVWPSPPTTGRRCLPSTRRRVSCCSGSSAT